MKGKRESLVLCILMLLVTSISLAGLGFIQYKAMAASVPDIKIAVVNPLSGALSRNGNLTVQCMKAAMNWVNDNGGIKSLGGAKLVPVVADSGSTVEGAANAMERTGRDPEILMAEGAWASSLTLAATEVTERMGIPFVSFGLADQLSNRGFKWGFYVCTPSSVVTEYGLPKFVESLKSAGVSVKKAMYVGDNSVSNKDFLNASKKVFNDMGIALVGEESWAIGTLTDATPVMQRVKTLKPDIVLFGAIAIAEAQMCLMKKKEFGINTPFLAFGGYAADPSFRQIGADVLEGLVALTGSFPHKLTPEEWIKRSLEQCRKEYSNELWVGQELSYGWVIVPIMAEILEKAGSRDRKAIRDAGAKLDIHNVMATRQVPMQGMAFGEDLRIAKKYRGGLIVQWQGGVPRTIYPTNLALAKPKW